MFICLLTVYILGTVCLAVWTFFAYRKELTDTTPNPEDTAGNLLQEVGKKKKNGCLASILYLIWFGVSFAITAVIYVQLSNLVQPAGYEKLNLDILVMGWIAAGFFSLGFVAMFPVAITRLTNYFDKKTIYGNSNIVNTFAFSKIWLLITFAVIFPFFALGVNNYAGYNESGIVYNTFFAIEAEEIKYTDIVEIDRYVHYDNSGNGSSLHYKITAASGTTLDPAFGTIGSYIAQTYAIHNYIKEQNPALIAALPALEYNDKTESFIRSDYTAAEREMIMEIFFGQNADIKN